MEAPFKVGEVVIGQNFVIDIEYNGMEAIVISAPEFTGIIYPDGLIETCNACEVKWESGLREWQKISHLRRRKPPATDTGERTFMAEIRKLAAPQRVGEPA